MSQEGLNSADSLSMRRPVTVPEEDPTVLMDDESIALPTGDGERSPVTVAVPVPNHESQNKPTPSASPRAESSVLHPSAPQEGEVLDEPTTNPSGPIGDSEGSPLAIAVPIRKRHASRSKPTPSASPRVDASLLHPGASLKGEDLCLAHSGYASIVVAPSTPAVEEEDTVQGEANEDRPVSAKTRETSVHSSETPMSPDQHYSLCSMIEYGVASEQGARKTMEDRHTARLTEAKADDHAEDSQMDDDVPVEDTPEETLAQGVPFFGVYDGHGGTQCAAYLRKKLDKLVLGHPKVIDEPEVALREAIDFAEQEFLEQFKEDSSGSTAAVAIIVGNKIITANVGDTEIVLNRGGVAVCLSEKHNVKSNENERERVLKAGGRLYQNARVAHPVYNPQVLSLGVSRAIGDSGFKLNEYTQGKPSGVVATASTKTTEFDYNADEFLLIGCDGLWDVMTYQQAVDFCVEVQKKGLEADSKLTPSAPLTPQQISSALVTRALDSGSNDNVTAMFISLRSRPRSATHRPPSAVHQRWGERTRSARKVDEGEETKASDSVILSNSATITKN